MVVPLRTILKPGDPPMRPLKEVETGAPEHVVYFAYRSNMSTTRLRERMPSCKPLGIATLLGYELRFHKRSKDNSGKCNAYATDDPDDSVVGVLFSFDPKERLKLDKAEGVGNGYDHANVTVVNDKGRRRKVLTYVATADYIDDALQPFDWYMDFVLAGAEEHALPDEFIRSVAPIPDPNKGRDKRERATLKATGS